MGSKPGAREPGCFGPRILDPYGYASNLRHWDSNYKIKIWVDAAAFPVSLFRVVWDRPPVMTPDERKEARNYAWSYFALHADQRMKLFNFFLILSGVILGAFSAVRGMAGGTRVVAILPLLLVLTAFIFWRLEERARRLVKNAEDALRFLDEQWSLEPLPDKTPHYLRLFERDDHLVEVLKKRWWTKRLVPMSYADSFRIAYLMIGGVGLVLAGWVLLT